MGEIRVGGLCSTHSNILTSVGLPLSTGGFPDHLGFDNKIVDGRVVWVRPVTSAHTS